MPIQYNSSGIITQNLNEILDEREQALRPIMGEDFTIDKTDPIGNMELADATSELSIQELIAYIFPNQLDANTATGIFLETICEKNRIYRKQPEYTRLNLTLHGTKNSQFFTGDITVEDSISGIYYNLNEDCIIGEDGIIKVQFICQEYGENYPLEASKFNILTPVVGLDSVTIDFENANIILGRLTETDEELRRRRFLSVQQTSTTLAESIKASLYSLDGVKNVVYFENDKEVVDENELPPKSFEYVVDGGDENKITDIIFINKTLGTRAYGTTIVTKKDSDNNIYNIGYTKANIINIGMDIEIDTASIQTNTWKENVKKSLIEKFEDIQKIGTMIKDYNYYVTLTKFGEIIDIKSIKFYNIEDKSKKYTQMPIHKKQIAKLDSNNINLTINIG